MYQVVVISDGFDDAVMIEIRPDFIEERCRACQTTDRMDQLGRVIAVGSYVRDLTDLALRTATNLGTVTVDMGETECKVPSASEYIRKVRLRGAIGKKRKTAKC